MNGAEPDPDSVQILIGIELPNNDKKTSKDAKY